MGFDMAGFGDDMFARIAKALGYPETPTASMAMMDDMKAKRVTKGGSHDEWYTSDWYAFLDWLEENVEITITKKAK